MPSGPAADPIKLTIINIPPLVTDGVHENLAIRDMDDSHAVTLKRFVCKLLGRTKTVGRGAKTPHRPATTRASPAR